MTEAELQRVLRRMAGAVRDTMAAVDFEHRYGDEIGALVEVLTVNLEGIGVPAPDAYFLALDTAASAFLSDNDSQAPPPEA